MDATEIAHGRLEGADSPYLFIWDIDGTLTQAPGVGRAVMEQVFRELFGIANAPEGIPMAGSLDSVIVGTAFDRLGLDRRRLPEYWTRYCARLEEALAADPTARTTPKSKRFSPSWMPTRARTMSSGRATSSWGRGSSCGASGSTAFLRWGGSATCPRSVGGSSRRPSAGRKPATAWPLFLSGSP